MATKKIQGAGSSTANRLGSSSTSTSITDSSTSTTSGSNTSTTGGSSSSTTGGSTSSTYGGSTSSTTGGSTSSSMGGSTTSGSTIGNSTTQGATQTKGGSSSKSTGGSSSSTNGSSIGGGTSSTNGTSQSQSNSIGGGSSQSTGKSWASGTVSDRTQAGFNASTQDYVQSAAVTNAYNALQEAISGKPTFQSSYEDQLANMYGQIMNREKFNYNFNQDAMYQQYKDHYTTAGKQAMQDTMGQAAAMSGGYGSSYAQTAGQQTYQNYLRELNNMIPTLRNQAYSEYQQEGQNMMDRYNLTNNMYQNEYGQYRDSMSDWQNDRSYNYGMYSDERNFDYSKYQGDRSFWQNEYWQEKNAEQSNNSMSTNSNWNNSNTNTTSQSNTDSTNWSQNQSNTDSTNWNNTNSNNWSNSDTQSSTNSFSLNNSESTNWSNSNSNNWSNSNSNNWSNTDTSNWSNTDSSNWSNSSTEGWSNTNSHQQTDNTSMSWQPSTQSGDGFVQFSNQNSMDSFNSSSRAQIVDDVSALAQTANQSGKSSDGKAVVSYLQDLYKNGSVDSNGNQVQYSLEDLTNIYNRAITKDIQSNGSRNGAQTLTKEEMARKLGIRIA